MIKRSNKIKPKKANLKKANPRTSRYAESLYKIALKFDNFDDFAEYYWSGLALGIYWIPSEDPDFIINKPLEKQYAKEGKLVAYISPEDFDTKYAIQIDISKLDPEQDITENKKDPNNSVKIYRPELIKAYYVYTVPKAIEVQKYNTRYLPSTRFSLQKLWEAAKNKEKEKLAGTVKKTVRRKKSKND